MTDGGFCAVCGSIDRLSPSTSILAYRIGRQNRLLAIHRRCFDRSQFVKVAGPGDAPVQGGNVSATPASGAK